MPSEAVAEAVARRAAMTTSSWAAASDPAREFMPVSNYPLPKSHLKSRSASQYGRHQRMAGSAGVLSGRPGAGPASSFIASKYLGVAEKDDVPEWAGTNGTNIVLGSDGPLMATMASEIGKTQHIPPRPVDLLETRPEVPDKTMDGEHAAALTEAHFLTVHYPYMSDNPKAAASFKSGVMLRDANRRHTRSAYHPDQKYAFPPSEMNEIGWKISEKYATACAKFAEGAPWHAREGSHITKFSERLLLGARHHVSGPLAPKTLHY